MNRRGWLIAETVAAWGTTELPLERAVLGTEDPDAIAAAVDAFCRERLGASVHAWRFFDSSSGSVHGVALADGRDVVLKLHRPAVTPRFLTAVTAIQRAIADVGFPAPRPIGVPAPLGRGTVTVEAMLCAPPVHDPHTPDVRRALARGFATLLELLRTAASDSTALGEHPMRRAPGALYPTPHGARFDFEATARGAEWIDDLAAQALERQSRRPRAPTQSVHKDFRVENAPVNDGRLAAVYDWDSLALDDEMAALANAASTFSCDWSNEAPRFPTSTETAAFIADYEEARGRHLDADELERRAISRTLLLCYTARCEHSDAGGVAATPAGSARALLAERCNRSRAWI